MLFTSAITTLLLATSAAAVPPTRVGVTNVNANSTLEARGSLTNITEAVVPRSLNFTAKPILPRSANLNSTVFPRLALDKNTTEGIFDKRDLVEGVAAPSGVVVKRDASPTGYVKRSFGTGNDVYYHSTFLTVPTRPAAPTAAAATSSITASTPASTPTPSTARGSGPGSHCGAGSGMDVWDRCIEALFLGLGH